MLKTYNKEKIIKQPEGKDALLSEECKDDSRFLASEKPNLHISQVMVYCSNVDCDNWKIYIINPKTTTKITQQKVNTSKLTKEIMLYCKN